MEYFGIKPVKSLGQNFLNDLNVVQEIVYCAGITKEDLVIEIGPGLGTMTEKLAACAGHVTAVELDRALIPVLESVLSPYDNADVIQGDILKTDISALISARLAEYKSLKRVKVTANLPYYITTPVIMMLLEDHASEIDSMTFMVQKEVARRMTASPGGKEYGALTVAAGYFSDVKVCFDVPPHCFIPQPAVDSSVIRLEIRKEPPFELDDRDFFFKVVRASFCQRRKMLANSLANAPYLGVARDHAVKCIEHIGKDARIRGETLSPAEFAALSNTILRSR